MKKSPYKDTEAEIQRHLISAWNLFVELERYRTDEVSTFGDGIHKCQSCLVLRTVQRDYPNEYPRK
jgi:hypothetical protein